MRLKAEWYRLFSCRGRNAQMMAEQQRGVMEWVNRGKASIPDFKLFKSELMRLMESVHGEEAHPERGVGDEVDGQSSW